MTGRVTRMVLALAAWLVLAEPALALHSPNPADPPAISGEPRWGRTLTVDNGDWNNLGSLSYSYAWFRCTPGCAPTGVATNTYTLGQADRGALIKAAVTAHDPLPLPHDAGPVESAPVGPVADDPPVSTAAPAFSGKAQTGETLVRTSDGAWVGPPPIGVATHWLRCDAAWQNCVELPGATGNRYTLRAADIGATLRLRARASGPFGSAEALSTPSAIVELGPARERRRGLLPRVVMGGRILRSGTRLTKLIVERGRGMTARVRCRGRGCPFARKTYRLRSNRVRLRALQRRYRAGAVIQLWIGSPDRDGRYTRIRIGRGGVPGRTDRCLDPGSTRPVRCG